MHRRRKRYVTAESARQWCTNDSQERERAAEEEEQREVEIARGNPLLNPQDFSMKRRWDDDVVFKNQARGTEKKEGKEFINVRLVLRYRCFPIVLTCLSRTCCGLTFTRGSWYVFVFVLFSGFTH